MAANSLNRETVRDALATLLQVALVGSGKPVQAVYNYEISDFADQSPIVVVTCGGTVRERGTLGTSWRTLVDLRVHVFTLYALTDGTWTEAQSEDRADLIEKKIADVVLDNYSNTTWDELYFTGQTQVQPLVLGGREYRMETISLKASKLYGLAGRDCDALYR